MAFLHCWVNMYSIGWQDCQCCYTSNCFKQQGLDYNIYETYCRGSYYCSTAVNVTGSRRNHVKTIIWACRINLLYFSSNSVIKKVFYEGSGRDAVKNVAKNEFFKDADVIYSSYKSLINIRIFHDGKY